MDGEDKSPNSARRDERGFPQVDITPILNPAKSRIVLEAEMQSGVTLIASHNPSCRGIDNRLEGEKIAHPVINVYSNGTIEVSCTYLDSRGDLELCHCGSRAMYNKCVHLRHDNTILRD